jgi:hypothetical protein
LLKKIIYFYIFIFSQYTTFLILIKYRENPRLQVVFIKKGINVYVERFNRTVRYEWLSQYYWKDLEEVQLFATKWMWSYNHERPNMALGGFTPKQHLAMAA